MSAIATAAPNAMPAPDPAGAGFHPGFIVCPLDGSQDSEAALPVAAYFAELYGAPVRVVRAVASEQFADPATAAAFEAYVAGLVTNGHLPGGARGFVAAGDPAEAIRDSAGVSDLIVIASHGQGGLKSALFGSVTDKAVRSARTPTVVVPVARPAGPFSVHQVVIAVDESECAAHATDIGRSLAERCGAAVTLVNAFLPVTMTASMEAPYVARDGVLIEQAAAEAMVASVAKPGEGQRVILGPTTDGVAEAAELVNAELVVAGARGRGFFARILTGSVSEGLMHRLDRPLLVVPAPPG